jgi:HlyD family secretion protein
MSKTLESRALRSSRRHNLAGIAAVAVLAGLVGGWATTTELAGAVVASGQLVVESGVKKVQHPFGGIVGELRVHDGDLVRAGDVLVRLDATETRANLAIITKSLDELAARQARDEAERDGESKIVFPQELLARKDDTDVQRLINGESKLFDIRSQARNGQKAQLKERISELQQQIEGLNTQIKAKEREAELIQQELKGIRELWKKQLVDLNRVTAMEREAARTEGERGALVSTVAQVKDRITETELQILQVDQDMRTEVGKELSEIRAKTSELAEKRIAAEDQLRRVDIRAPQGGRVHQLSVHTVGGVIQPGEAIMLIVPSSDALTVEAKIPPQEIDQLYLGQPAVLRFTAFNQRTTPELNGEVSRISADISQDQKTGLTYYTTRIKVTDAEVTRLGNVKLIPGMPVEAFVETAPRTVLSYLARPFYDQAKRAFTEK